MLNISTSFPHNYIFELCAYIFNGLSFLSSLSILLIIYSKNLNSQISNQFIVHITFSEMLNSITILSSFVMDKIGNKEEKYTERMRICNTQVFTGLFANFYTLSSSFLIAFRIYDLLLNNALTFKHSYHVKIAKLLSFYGCLLTSYILWLIQMNLQNYEQTTTKSLKVLSCWVGDYPDLIVIGIYVLFLIIILYFCIKGSSFITKYANQISQDDSLSGDINESNNADIEKVKAIQKRLIIFPVSTIIIFSLIISHRIIARAAKGDELLTNITFILYTISTSLRGFIFAIVYLGAQQIVKKSIVDIFCCRICKRKQLPKVKSILEEINEDRALDGIVDEEDEGF